MNPAKAWRFLQLGAFIFIFILITHSKSRSLHGLDTDLPWRSLQCAGDDRKPRANAGEKKLYGCHE